MSKATFKVWRGAREAGEFKEYTAEVGEGMVVLDCVHQIQATQAPDLACRWNCKAGKCGSCSAEINGKPALMCMKRLSDLPLEEPVTIEPMRTFPLLKLKGLDPAAQYAIEPIEGKTSPGTPSQASGAWWMNHGLDLGEGFRGDFQAAAFRLDKK